MRRKPAPPIIASLLALGIALPLAACSSTVDTAATRTALSEVTEDPAPPEAAREYDAELSPDPIVDPLECTPYLVVTARGTDEPSKGQLLSPVARAVSEARPDEVQTLDLDYPADTDIKEGGTVGARRLIDTLNVQADTCPEQQFVLLGYSQGALVVGDALSAPDTRLVGSTVGEVDESAVERVIAVVFYGDPRFVGSEAFDYGSYDPALNGILPRPPGSLDAYADRLRDYCVTGDFVCQSSLDLDEQPHLEYYDNGMQGDGAAFVVTRMDPPREKPDEAADGADPEGPGGDAERGEGAASTGAAGRNAADAADSDAGSPDAG